jgi:uncharacterized membrane protein YkoI
MMGYMDFSKTILMMSLIAVAGAAEKKIKMQDMPATVQQAVKDQSKGAAIRGFAQEVENGKTLYEMELTVNGHAKDVTFDGAGKVVSVEEEVPLESIAVPAREAIQKAVGKGKLQKVESVTENGSSFYEASIRKAGKSSEFKVDANGAAVK